MLFYFIDKLMGFHLRGQRTFQDKNFGSYTDFPKALKMPIFDDVNEKSDDVIKKTQTSYIIFCSSRVLLSHCQVW